LNSKLSVIDPKKGQRYTKFAVYFLVLLFLSQIVTHLEIISEPLTYGTTHLTFQLIKIFYKQITLNGFHILGGIDMEIIYECTGIYGIIVFTSAVLSSWYLAWEKALALLWGIPCIYALNLIRLVSIFLISQWRPSWFDFMHTFFWQLFLLFFVVYFFYTWLLAMQKKYP
jgi:exosortase/archaeosortase family protein